MPIVTAPLHRVLAILLLFAHNQAMALTKRQKEVLDYIADFVEEHGYSPSYEELAQGLKVASLATVHKHIEGLEARNYLRRGFNQSRSLEIAPKYYEEQRQHRQTNLAFSGRQARRLGHGFSRLAKPHHAPAERQARRSGRGSGHAAFCRLHGQR